MKDFKDITEKRKEVRINPETDRFYDVINGELVYNDESNGNCASYR